MVGANRAIIFDACWNPSLDTQAIYRIFRYGQVKPVFIYRFTAHGTMESKIYKRQIQKQSIALRVVDEFQIERHFEEKDLKELYQLSYREDNDEPETVNKPLVPPTNDRVLSEIFPKLKPMIVSYHAHNSLLENLPGEKLSEHEKSEAWDEFMMQTEENVTTQQLVEPALPNFQHSKSWNYYYNQFYQQALPIYGQTSNSYVGNQTSHSFQNNNERVLKKQKTFSILEKTTQKQAFCNIYKDNFSTYNNIYSNNISNQLFQENSHQFQPLRMYPNPRTQNVQSTHFINPSNNTSQKAYCQPETSQFSGSCASQNGDFVFSNNNIHSPQYGSFDLNNDFSTLTNSITTYVNSDDLDDVIQVFNDNFQNEQSKDSLKSF